MSVNFHDNSVQATAKDKEKSNKIKANQKPSVIIDLLDDNESYKVIEEEKELVDIASDNEKENTDPTTQVPTTNGDEEQDLPTKGPQTPPEPDRFTDRYDPFDPTVSPDNEPESLPVEPQVTPPLQPCTPPPAQTPEPQEKQPDPSPGVKLAPSPNVPNSNHKRRWVSPLSLYIWIFVTSVLQATFVQQSASQCFRGPPTTDKV